MAGAPSLPTNLIKPTPVLLDTERKLEEETLPFYDPRRYYPVHLGEIFQSKYKVITKLGYGVNSTVWLCYDLKEDRYLTLKLRTLAAQHEQLHDDQELFVFQHLANSSLSHIGKGMIRLVLDSFEVSGPYGMHKALLHEPLWASFAEFLDLLPARRFPANMLRQATQLILTALDYLHKCDVVHTDLTPNNVLMRVKDPSILSRVAQEEDEEPNARIVRSDRTIYTSRLLPISPGQPVIGDFGEARVGRNKHRGIVMPRVMRAPEVILGMDWDNKVDIWAIGTMTWHLLTGRPSFSIDLEGPVGDEQHLAEMVSVLGEPPKQFIQRSGMCRKYWDSEGSWKGSVPIPGRSFEFSQEILDDRSQIFFKQFIGRALQWLPEERPTAEELAFAEFLMQHIEHEKLS